MFRSLAERALFGRPPSLVDFDVEALFVRTSLVVLGCLSLVALARDSLVALARDSLVGSVGR